LYRPCSYQYVTAVASQDMYDGLQVSPSRDMLAAAAAAAARQV
jgi:hypothetical protein